jgi:hypothetical protein
MVKGTVFFSTILLCGIATEINSPTLFVCSFIFGLAFMMFNGGPDLPKDIKDTHTW